MLPYGRSVLGNITITVQPAVGYLPAQPRLLALRQSDLTARFRRQEPGTTSKLSVAGELDLVGDLHRLAGPGSCLEVGNDRSGPVIQHQVHDAEQRDAEIFAGA